MLASMLGIGFYHYSLPLVQTTQNQKAKDDGRNEELVEILPVLHIYALVDLVAVSLSCVVAIGWTADPNALSLHDFYKFRLVRAYLGGSNPRRAMNNSEITDSVEGDDVRMSELANCSCGGPYHLVNVTLNLTAGHDLATAQRSSALRAIQAVLRIAAYRLQIDFAVHGRQADPGHRGRNLRRGG